MSKHDTHKKVEPDTQEPAAPVAAPEPAVPAATKRFSEEYITTNIPRKQSAGELKSLRWVTKEGKEFGICSKFGELTFEDGELFVTKDRAEADALVSKLRALRPNDDIRVSVH